MSLLQKEEEEERVRGIGYEKEDERRGLQTRTEIEKRGKARGNKWRGRVTKTRRVRV